MQRGARGRHYRRTAAAAAALVALVLGLAHPALAGPTKLHSLPPGVALTMLLAGKPLTLVEIHKRVDLSATKITAPFECTVCKFDKGFVARNVVFPAAVNLRGSEFNGPVDLRGATFQGPVLFSLATTFNSTADFRLATFNDSAAFDTSDFVDAARFELARFRHAADFDQASFEAIGRFSGAQFSETGRFVGTTFAGKAFFDHTGGNVIDFTFATLPDTTDLESVTAGTLSFDHATFAATTTLLLNNLVAGNLVMDPADVRYVNSDARGRALDVIQSSAKARGDLGVANDAYYRIRERRGNTWGWLGHAVDVVFYREIAGYLVVPWRPLVALVLLALLIALWRSRRAPLPPPVERDVVGTGAPHTPHRGRFVPARLSRWGHEILDSLTLILPRLGGGGSGRRLESFVYRVLFVCMLFGFANSNPTLRQMLDAIL